MPSISMILFPEHFFSFSLMFHIAVDSWMGGGGARVFFFLSEIAWRRF